MATGSTPVLDRASESSSPRSRSIGSLVEWTWQPVDAASFVAFRVAFGLLIVVSTVRFIARGWVDTFYLDPAHHLTYAGFDWVRPLPPVAMYLHMVGLVALGCAIAFGYRTRLAAAVFAVMFAYVELIDAALYLNHYWFVTLTAVALAFVPSPRSGRVPRIGIWVLRAQLGVVYFFAGVAKLNPDWLMRAQPMALWLAARTDRPIIGPILDEAVVAFAFSWAGAFFDLTIVGWLLWRRTRPFAYATVVVFHLMTAMLFQIGVFPWVMIALTPIYFSVEWPRVLARRVGASFAWQRHDRITSLADPLVRPRPLVLVGVVSLALINVWLPLRHYLAPGNVRFDDDGYYLSWRVMLTERAGFVDFEVTDPTTGETWNVRPDEVLAEWQAAQVTRRPDLILTSAHIVADLAAADGHDDVSVRADAWVAFNGRSRQRWIDPQVDLARLDHGAAAETYVLGLESDDDRPAG